MKCSPFSASTQKSAESPKQLVGKRRCSSGKRGASSKPPARTDDTSLQSTKHYQRSEWRYGGAAVGQGQPCGRARSGVTAGLVSASKQMGPMGVGIVDCCRHANGRWVLSNAAAAVAAQQQQ
jgi:hypothetical protein